MANLTIENTGIDGLYPDGVPIAEVSIAISDIYKKIARITSLAVIADPYFNGHTGAQKIFSELHGESDRITRDFLEEGAKDVAQVFTAFQRWMTDDSPGPAFEFDLGDSGNIVYRWQIMDTRLTDDKLNFTVETIDNIVIDTQNVVSKVEKYLIEALRDYVLQELYKTIGYDKKYGDYKRDYVQSRQNVAYWVKNDKSSQTQYRHAGL